MHKNDSASNILRINTIIITKNSIKLSKLWHFIFNSCDKNNSRFIDCSINFSLSESIIFKKYI